VVVNRGELAAMEQVSATSGRHPAVTALGGMPALQVLDRLPIPVLAVSQSGTILFANDAFAEMVGLPAAEVQAKQLDQIFYTAPRAHSAVRFMRDFAGLVVELAHADGSVVSARMSRSALLRSDDPVALTSFQDLTEQLWAAGH
jgi:PAS domain S-box-containing protein